MIHGKLGEEMFETALTLPKISLPVVLGSVGYWISFDPVSHAALKTSSSTQPMQNVRTAAK